MNLQNSDFNSFLPTLPDKSIDLIILDPPYYRVVKQAWDNQWKTLTDYINWFETLLVQLERVSKYSASLWVFGFPEQLYHLLPKFEKHGFKYRQMITVYKGLQSVAGRTSSKLKMFPTATEYILYFHRDCRSLVREILQERKLESNLSSKQINELLGVACNGGGIWSSIAGMKKSNLEYPTRQVWEKLNSIFKRPLPEYDDYVYTFNQQVGLTDVWTDINFYDKTYPKIHPTQKPYKLIERIILASSCINDTVLDTFFGSGMTAKVCMNTGRKFIGCEKDKNYYDLSCEFLKKNNLNIPHHTINNI